MNAVMGAGGVIVPPEGYFSAIQDVLDLIDADAYPADQINADPGTTAFQQFLAGTGSMLMWWGDIGSSAKTSDTSVVGDTIGFSTRVSVEMT